MPDEPAPGEELPEAAERRLGGRAFSSGLGVADFAGALEAGLEPVGLVQGFCVMQWGWYGAGSPYGLRGAGPYGAGTGGYVRNYTCPHGFVSAEHRTWGQNYEQPWVEQAWARGFGAAFSRLLDEARTVGAHGVVGVTDRATLLGDLGVTEFHLLGTAVRVPGAPELDTPWTTYLAGQRLVKLLEAGLMPVSVAAAMASVRMWPYCMTEYLMEGGAWSWGGTATGVQEVDQVTDAHGAVRRLVREHVRQRLGGDALHGAELQVHTRRLGAGDELLEATLRGTRVRRVRPAAPLPAPRPTVRLT